MTAFDTMLRSGADFVNRHAPVRNPNAESEWLAGALSETD